MDYCEFLTELTGMEFGLPTEAQWEFAARGTDRNEYPWGKYFDANKVVSNISGTQPVDTLPDGKSWCDARDMSGNVWELAFDWYKNKYDTKDLMNPKGPQSGTYKVRRGGSFCSDGLTDMRGASRDPVLPGYRDYDFGFRVSEVLI
jgi:formylglycine-generating enzyme required for sulfatase activity